MIAHTHMSERIHLSPMSWVEKGMLPRSFEYDFEQLWTLHPVEFGKVKIMGKVIDTPRWQQSYEHSYWYSGMMHVAPSLPEPFQPFKEWANGLGWGHFNQALINWYDNGHHYIGKHSDDTTQLVHRSAILSISMGAERTFRIRRKGSEEKVMDVAMPTNSYLVMGGAMQEEFTHEVPKIAGKKGATTIGRRINVTLRQFRQ